LNPHEAFPLEELSNPPAVDWETIAKLIQIKHQHALVVHGGCFNRRKCGSQACDGIVGPMVENMFNLPKVSIGRFDPSFYNCYFLQGSDSGPEWNLPDILPIF